MFDDFVVKMLSRTNDSVVIPITAAVKANFRQRVRCPNRMLCSHTE